MDEQSIVTGERWPESLRTALKYSRCYVGVWSPEYFQSDWCMSEWKTFLEREKLTNAKPLIASLRYNDGDYFPDEARETQWTDVEPYSYTLPIFWKNPLALDLEKTIKDFAGQVGKIIESVPKFDPTWKIADTPALPPRKIGLPRL